MSFEVQEAPLPAAGREEVINNFSLNIATINGSGSQTSNGVLLAFFKMGIPVVGKNLFPQQHPGPAHLVRHPSEQGWLPGAS